MIKELKRLALHAPFAIKNFVLLGVMTHMKAILVNNINNGKLKMAEQIRRNFFIFH